MGRRKNTDRKIFSVGEIATICQVARRTVTAWIDRGTLTGYRIPGRGAGERRVTRSALIAFLARNQIPHDPKDLDPVSGTDPKSELTPEQLHDQVLQRAEAARTGEVS